MRYLFLPTTVTSPFRVGFTRVVYFHETSHMRSFVNIKSSGKFLNNNLQYCFGIKIIYLSFQNSVYIDQLDLSDRTLFLHQIHFSILKQKINVRFLWYCIFRSSSDVASRKKKMFIKRQTHKNWQLFDFYLLTLKGY